MAYRSSKLENGCRLVTLRAVMRNCMSVVGLHTIAATACAESGTSTPDDEGLVTAPALGNAATLAQSSTSTSGLPVKAVSCEEERGIAEGDQHLVHQYSSKGKTDKGLSTTEDVPHNYATRYDTASVADPLPRSGQNKGQ